jgi:UDP-N-acetylmuramate dehydrogenase
VLAVRRGKSMVLDPNDPNTRSAGSFFMNPVLTTQDFADLQARWHAAGNADPIPTLPAAAGGVKVPAAWLVERAGFAKGYRRGRVGISSRHALALVNHGGTAAQLLALAGEIVGAVQERFEIRLEPEPDVVGPPVISSA